MSPLIQAYLHARLINQQFDRYEALGRSEAARNGELCEDIEQNEVGEAIARHRLILAECLLALTPDERRELVHIDEIYVAADRMRGTLFGRAWEEMEQALITRQLTVFGRNWNGPECFAAFVILSFYFQPFELPLQDKIDQLSPEESERYLAFVMRQPHLMTEEDEDRYLVFYKQLTTWLLQLIEASDAWDVARRSALLRLITQRLTFGACYYLDRPIIEIVKMRARIVAAVVQRDPENASIKGFPPQTARVKSREKIRLGIYSRNIADYTDTRALYALFHAFNPNRYEIYWYTLDVLDPSSLTDVGFMRQLSAFAYKIVSLRGNAAAMARTILLDDLDIFVVGTGYSFSVKDIDQMLYHRLGRVQVALSELISGSSAFPSYDYYFVPEADPDVMAIYRQESTEQLKVMKGPVLWYEKRPKAEPSPEITRSKLGIPEDAVIYCSGAAANKQMAGTLRAWFKILQRVPNSYLLLYPFNPAWGGYFIGLTFMARLRSIMKQFPDIAPERIIVVRQVTPQDGNRLIQLSDIYLGSFPRGGATSAMLALRNGKPVIARREKWLHSHDDAVLLRCLGCNELIGRDRDAMINIAIELGNNPAKRNQIAKSIADKAESAPFFDIEHNSKEFQKLFDGIMIENASKKKNSY
jgi:predicted O-linked N-acetylglucosamine transferase (SPINDLY family)